MTSKTICRELPNPHEHPTMSVAQAGYCLGLNSKDQAYRYANQGFIPIIPLGTRRKVVSTFKMYELLGVPLPANLADKPEFADTHPAQAGE